MDKFTPYLLPFRFIDSHFLSFLDSLLASRSSYDPSFAPLHTLSPFFHDPHPPHPHPYICAPSAFLAVVRLLCLLQPWSSDAPLWPHLPPLAIRMQVLADQVLPCLRTYNTYLNCVTPLIDSSLYFQNRVLHLRLFLAFFHTSHRGNAAHWLLYFSNITYCQCIWVSFLAYFLTTHRGNVVFGCLPGLSYIFHSMVGRIYDHLSLLCPSFSFSILNHRPNDQDRHLTPPFPDNAHTKWPAISLFTNCYWHAQSRETHNGGGTVRTSCVYAASPDCSSKCGAVRIADGCKRTWTPGSFGAAGRASGLGTRKTRIKSSRANISLLHEE